MSVVTIGQYFTAMALHSSSFAEDPDAGIKFETLYQVGELLKQMGVADLPVNDPELAQRWSEMMASYDREMSFRRQVLG